MELKKIIIENFKSINNIEFDIKKYGDSYTTMLVGINESGKSNVLEAMSFLEVDSDKKFYLKTMQNKKNERNKGIDILFHLDANANKTLIKEIEENIKGISLLEFNFGDIYKQTYLRGNNPFKQFIDFSPFDIPDIHIPANLFIKKVIKSTLKKGVALNQDIITITKNDDGTFEALTEITFDEYIKPKIDEAIEKHIPAVSFWTPSSKYLLSSVDLNAFKDDIDSNIPLKNIFILAGYEKNTIILEIENIDDAPTRGELESRLNESVNQYIKKIWEHNIDIIINITETGRFSLLLRDQGHSNRHDRFKIDQRSDGAKHFLSLILSLSLETHNKERKNQLILIDEPEMHLHPSAIRDLREELLKIGKDNYLFVATHSPFLIDKKHKERNIIIKKNDNACTEIHKIKEHEDILDDEVLKEAFGMEVYKDLLNPHSLLVEGASDKQILQKAFSLEDMKYSITNGHGGSIKSIASKLNRDDISILVIVDDDKDGRKYKEDILKIEGVYSKKNVFTIKDLVGNIKAGGTIEDTLNKEFMESQFNKFITSKKFKSEAIILKEDEPFMAQIKAYINKFLEKDKPNSKINLDKYLSEFKTQFATSFNPNTKSLAEKFPLLQELVKEIANKLKNN